VEKKVVFDRFCFVLCFPDFDSLFRSQPVPPPSDSPLAVASPSPAAEQGTTFRNLFSSSKKAKKANAPLLLGEMSVHSGSVLAVETINQVQTKDKKSVLF
jgi:hypothetical protein